MRKKICTKCCEGKYEHEFYKDKQKSDGLCCICKICHKHRVLEYTKNNPEKNRKWKKKGIVNFKQKNPDYYKTYFKNRKKTDFLFKLCTNMRIRLNVFLKTKRITKSNKTFNIIGCTPFELKVYLEEQFTYGMGWENHGEWHIDHIIPLSSAKTDEEIYKLCHYTNLQPLWSYDNIKKGSK